MTDARAVDIEGLWFSYDQAVILQDVDLEIGRREMVCLIGPNGGGKTTLLKLMLGLLRPDRGRIRVLGRRPGESGGAVGYAPQHARFDERFPVTVMDVALMGRLGLAGSVGGYGRSHRKAARRALDEVGLGDHLHRPLAELSGGQRQRVLIARALASGPELLLLDEPTSNLDASVEAELYDLLAGLSERMSVVLVSHDIAFVTERVQKVVCVQGTVAVHPTADLTGDIMRDLYGRDIRLVRHDHDCLQQCKDAPAR
jgi:zinc transport system ATP-binding protein